MQVYLNKCEVFHVVRNFQKFHGMFLLELSCLHYKFKKNFEGDVFGVDSCKAYASINSVNLQFLFKKHTSVVLRFITIFFLKTFQYLRGNEVTTMFTKEEQKETFGIVYT